jgi:uncharacterized membrane protein
MLTSTLTAILGVIAALFVWQSLVISYVLSIVFVIVLLLVAGGITYLHYSENNIRFQRSTATIIALLTIVATGITLVASANALTV